MPLVKIEVVKGKTVEYKKALLDGVHSALVEALKIPDYDRMQRLYELDKESFEYPSIKTDKITLNLPYSKGGVWKRKKSYIMKLSIT